MLERSHNRILVAYASRLGSTGEVAEVIAGVLSADGHRVDLRSAAEVDELDSYPDVVPATVAIFGGVVDPAKLSCPFNRLPASDARDWTAIRAWAAEASSLFAAQAVPL